MKKKRVIDLDHIKDLPDSNRIPTPVLFKRKDKINFAEIWDDIKEKKYKNEYIKEIDENMPSRKRTVKYSENTDPIDGDKNVEVSEEQSVENNDNDSNQQNESNTDERYTASAG